MTASILVDIDGVLSDASWRSPDGNWDAFHAGIPKDKPFLGVINIINACYDSDITVIGLTGRPQKWEPLTLEWLVKHRVMLAKVLFRPDADFRPAPLVKWDRAVDYFGSELKLRTSTLALFDDDENVITLFRAAGITTFHVTARNIA